MRRYLYRCPVCRTTSPLCRTPAELKAEGESHRHDLHGGHFPDGEKDGEVDRRGRWYDDLGWLTTLHARLTDAYADLHDPHGTGHRLWAGALAWLTLTAGALTTLWATTAALQP
ncbi:hypothetical protein Stsp01_64540 [Streptomyces sp. NBRC 13847]|uniref:hypothetical protein n=1 Tax=Streptomyces TaxID=1883 RepID=UPI0024A00E2B|nr:hypothetical protein [Streptomyces sp. NBRC 13847]GLW19711.1 hypothetical protein Stsp01_64540 [Streptomyces sp. NBRC 13847]